MRHTGNEQHEKDPDLGYFRKVVKKPTVLSSTLTPRASPAAYGIHSSYIPTSCSAEANLSSQVDEQFLSWPSSHDGCMMDGDIPQFFSSTYAAGNLENPQSKTPKIVLRKDLKDMIQKRKAPQNTYFMVVNKNKHRKKKLVSVKNNICRKKAEDIIIALRLKRLKRKRNKLIAQLYHELQCVMNRLDQCNRSKKQIEKELRVVKADLEETKRKMDFRNEDLMKKNAEIENEILKLKQKDEMLTTACIDLYAEHATIYMQRLENPWNYDADDQMSKHLHDIEDQKLELQRYIEELESKSRALKHSMEIERKECDAKLNHFFKVIIELNKRYVEEQKKSTLLKLQREFFERNFNI